MIFSCTSEPDYSNLPFTEYTLETKDCKAVQEVIESRLNRIGNLRYQFVPSEKEDCFKIRVYNYFPSNRFRRLLSENGNLKIVFPNGEVLVLNEEDKLEKNYGAYGSEVWIHFSEEHTKTMAKLSKQFIGQHISFLFLSEEIFKPKIGGQLSKTGSISSIDESLVELIIGTYNHPIDTDIPIEVVRSGHSLLQTDSELADLVEVHDSIYQGYQNLRDTLNKYIAGIKPNPSAGHNFIEIINMIQQQPLEDFTMKYKLSLQDLEYFMFNLKKNVPKSYEIYEIQKSLNEINQLLNIN